MRSEKELMEAVRKNHEELQALMEECFVEREVEKKTITKDQLGLAMKKAPTLQLSEIWSEL